MKITRKEITIQELTEGYIDNQEDGIRGYGGKLDVVTLGQKFRTSSITSKMD